MNECEYYVVQSKALEEALDKANNLTENKRFLESKLTSMMKMITADNFPPYPLIRPLTGCTEFLLHLTIYLYFGFGPYLIVPVLFPTAVVN